MPGPLAPQQLSKEAHYGFFPNSIEEQMKDEILSKGKLETYWKLYPHLPKSLILKAEALTRGVRFTAAAVERAKELGSRFKTYYLFSFDHDSPKGFGESIKHVPEDFRLADGPIVQTRRGAVTPYSIDVIGDKLMFCEMGEPVWEIEGFSPPFDYYKETLHGVPMYEYAAITQWDLNIFITALRACQYWGPNEECKFCDINKNLRMNHELKQGKVVGLKKPDDTAEVVWRAVNEKNPGHRKPIRAQITGGAITGEVAGGLDDEAFYGQHVKRIRERVGKHLYIKLETIAKTREQAERLHEAGADGHEANPEVLDPKLFDYICPGKSKQFGGLGNWLRLVIESVEVFGEGNVTPDIVQGIEMSQPFGFKTAKEAAESTLSGVENLMRNGVVPRMVPWIVESGSFLTENRTPPLEYFLDTTQGWYDLWRKYKLPDVGGYPPRGSGSTDCHALIMDMGDSNYK